MIVTSILINIYECVICNRVYVDEKDAAELERLVATKQIASSSRSPLNPTPISTSDISSPLRVQNNNTATVMVCIAKFLSVLRFYWIRLNL